MNKQTTITLVAVDIDYIKYLHTHGDTRVQFNPAKEATYQSKPYVGALIFVDGLPYFAPLESPRPAHLKMKSNLHIIKINGGKNGIIGLNNMVPVPREAIRWFNIYDMEYAESLRRIYIYCNIHKAELRERAAQVYEHRKQPNEFEKRIYCDFAKLEEASYHYCKEKGYAIHPRLAARFAQERHLSR